MSDRRLVLVGTGVVGVTALLAAGSGAAGSAPVLIPAAVIVGLAIGWGRSVVGAIQSSSIVLAMAAVMAALVSLDLLAVLTDLDDLAAYGGLTGLLARVGEVAGAGLTALGAVRLWRHHRDEGERATVEGSDRLALIGGLMVVLAWVGMVTSVWFLPADQAFGVAAATMAVTAVFLHTRSSLALPPAWRSVLMISLAVVTVGMALKSVIGTVGDWGFLVEFGGLRVVAPYLVYLLGAALLGATGFMEVRALRRSGDGVKLDHVAAVTVVGLVTLVAAVTGLSDGGGRADAAEATPTTVGDVTPTDAPAETDTVALGPEVPPIDACQLLNDEEVDRALGITETSGFMIFGGGEACTWQPFDAEEEDELYVALSPGSPDDFGQGAKRSGVEGVPVSEVGDLALWFGGDVRGVLTVIAGTDIGYALLTVEVSRPDADDTTRLDAATALATSAVSRLRGETPETVEAALCELVSDAEAEALLAPHRAGRAAARDELHVIGPSAPVDLTRPGDSSCQKLILTEIYVETATGDPADFEPGAVMEGVAGEGIDGVGDEAIWFEDVPRQPGFSSPHEAGILAVREGPAHLRLALSLPDLTAEARLEAAKRLASNALARMRAGDATVITIEHETRDTGGAIDLVGNLVAREEAGEWTEGEGLVQTLSMIVGEADVAEVVPQGRVVGQDATGIVNMARAHLAEAPDSPEGEELRRLLGMIVFEDDQLEEMAGVGSPTASLGWAWSLEAAAATSEDCTAFFTGWKTPPGIGKCLEKRTSPTLEASYPGQYKVFGPASPLPTAGWQDKHYDLAVKALEEIVPHYKSLGKLPAVNIVFSVIQHPSAGAVAAPHLANVPKSQNRPCGVTLFRNLQDDDDLTFKQFVAHELAHCLHGDTFSHHYSPELSDWWDEGLADYLSNTINDEYAGNNLEWAGLSDFDSAELGTGVADRRYDNFIFFQQLSNAYSDQAIFDIISFFPDDATREQQEASMSAYGGMAGNYHRFVEKTSDIAIEDTGGKIIPNVPDSDPYTLTGPTLILDQPLPFGATRLALSVPDGKYACIEHDQSDEVITSWRVGLPGVATGHWSRDMPDVLTGDTVVVATAVGPGAQMSINVEAVADDPDCGDDEETDPPDTSCVAICGPSSYYRFRESLPEPLRGLLPAP